MLSSEYGRGLNGCALQDRRKNTPESYLWARVVTHEVVFTWKDYDFSQIENHELSDKELADFGFNVLVRLVVLFKQPYK